MLGDQKEKWIKILSLKPICENLEKKNKKKIKFIDEDII